MDTDPELLACAAEWVVVPWARREPWKKTTVVGEATPSTVDTWGLRCFESMQEEMLSRHLNV